MGAFIRHGILESLANRPLVPVLAAMAGRLERKNLVAFAMDLDHKFHQSRGKEEAVDMSRGQTDLFRNKGYLSVRISNLIQRHGREEGR